MRNRGGQCYCIPWPGQSGCGSARMSLLSLERLKELQAECMADDIECDLRSMSHWEEAQVVAFFENGGQKKAPPSKQDLVDLLAGKEPEPGLPSADGSTGVDPSNEFGDAEPPREERAASSRSLPDIRQVLGDAPEEDEEPKQHELPQPPGEVMTVDEAYAFLGIEAGDRGDLDKLKARFRKLSLKYHPDKNRGREKQASTAFQGVHAAYHFLTTLNFDYKRWVKAFKVPPMQSLEDVLVMALAGEVRGERGEGRVPQHSTATPHHTTTPNHPPSTPPHPTPPYPHVAGSV